MAEAVAKEQICDSCGAEIRPDSLFCYSCGGSLEAELAEMEKKGASAAWSRGDLAEESAENEKEDREEKAGAKENKSQNDDDSALDEGDANGKIEVKAKPAKVDEKDSEKKGLKTAASLRKKPKKLGKKRVEVVWEEHDNSPNVWFIVGAVIFTILGAALFYIAMYLK